MNMKTIIIVLIVCTDVPFRQFSDRLETYTGTCNSIINVDGIYESKQYSIYNVNLNYANKVIFAHLSK